MIFMIGNSYEKIVQRVRYYISLKHEGKSWDFKREWHHDSASLLHDIICMANQIENEDDLIIIGVDEEKNCEIRDVSNNGNRKNTQQLVTFLRCILSSKFPKSCNQNSLFLNREFLLIGN